MALFRRKGSPGTSRSDIEEERTELEVESVLIHVRILARELMGALDDLEEAVTNKTSELKDGPTESKERHEPPF